MTDTHPVQSEFNSAAQRNHNRKRDNCGKKNSFLRFSVPDPGKDHSPDQKDGRHDLLEADKAVLKVVVIPETFQDDSPGTAQKHEQDPQIPVLSSFPRQEKHENKKQDNSGNGSNQPGCHKGNTLIVGITDSQEGPFRKIPFL